MSGEIPAGRQLSQQDFPDIPTKLLKSLNGFMGDVSGLFSGGVRVAGHMGVVDTFNVTVPDDWIAPTFTNSWVNYSSVDPTRVQAAYRKDSNGIVHIRGEVQLGVAGSSVFTLPVAYRPAAYSRHVINFAGGVGVGGADARTTGDVVPEVAAGSGFIALNNISFSASDRTPYVPSCWPLKISVPFKPRMVWAVSAQDTSKTTPSNRTGPLWIDWEFNSERGVYVRNMLGLVPGKSYRITYAALKG